MTQPIDLYSARCIPRSGAEHRLSVAELDAYLARLLGWELVADGKVLQRRFNFADYYRTLSFVNALAHIAHRQDHHPDLSVHYDRVLVHWSTHDVGGLSLNDVICAAQTSALTE